MSGAKIGRPASPMTARYMIRATPEELFAWGELAAADGLTLPNWTRRELVAAAEGARLAAARRGKGRGIRR